MNEEVTSLYCLPWDAPEADIPTQPIVIKIHVCTARAVLKKVSVIRIPSNLGKSQSIITNPESLRSYHDFSLHIRASSRFLETNQNVIYFSDFEEEHKFIHEIECLWAIAKEKNEITILAVTLNNDLAGRLVRWEKVSQTVIEDLIPPPPPDAKKQSIASMEAINDAERRSKVTSIFDEESNMDFAGPIYRRNQDEVVSNITVWKKYVPLLLSLNSLAFTIDNQFKRIGRTIDVNPEIVSDICTKILEEHSIEKE